MQKASIPVILVLQISTGVSVLTCLFVFKIKKKEERSHIKVKNIVYYMIIVLHCAVLY